MIKSIFTNSFGILFSRVFGFLRDMTTASILGVNIYSDIFFVTFQLPNLFRRIFAEGAFLQAFLPSFIHSKKRILLFASIFSSIFLIILTLTILVYIFDFQTAKLVFAGFSDEVISKAIIFLKINFLFLPLIFVTTILGAILNFKNHFWISSFSSAFINIGIILALLLSENKTPKEIALFMSFGVLIGAIFQVAIHLIGIKTVKMTKVITYGTFDLFHIGHLNLLKRAKKLGDYLIVGLSTDKFNIKKGKRSIYPYEMRKEILSAIKYVDDVIPEKTGNKKKKILNNIILIC